MPSREKTSGSLLMGLAILRCLASERTALGMSQIAARTGVPKATAHRLLRTLATLGYVSQRPDSRKYALDTSVLDLAHSLIASFLPDRDRLRDLHRRALEGRYGVTIAVSTDGPSRTVGTLGIPPQNEEEQPPLPAGSEVRTEDEAPIETAAILNGPADAPRFSIVLNFPCDTELPLSPLTKAELTASAAAELTNAYWPLRKISPSR